MIPSTTAKKTTTTSDGGRVTVVPGDGCYDVAADHGISLTNVRAYF